MMKLPLSAYQKCNKQVLLIILVERVCVCWCVCLWRGLSKYISKIVGRSGKIVRLRFKSPQNNFKKIFFLTLNELLFFKKETEKSQTHCTKI